MFRIKNFPLFLVTITIFGFLSPAVEALKCFCNVAHFACLFNECHIDENYCKIGCKTPEEKDSLCGKLAPACITDSYNAKYCTCFDPALLNQGGYGPQVTKKQNFYLKKFGL